MRKLARARDFAPQRNFRSSAASGVNSHRCELPQNAIFWWHHVNKYIAKRGNRSELAVQKSPRYHVNSPLVNYLSREMSMIHSIRKPK